MSARATLGQTPSTNPTRTIVPVQFNASTGDITVGSKTYKGANPGFHVVALSRQPNPRSLDAPDLVWDQTYTDGPSVVQALLQIGNTDQDALLLVNAVGNYGFSLADPTGNIGGVPVSVGFLLGGFGAYPDLKGVGATIPLIFIGTGGGAQSTALQRGGSTRDLTGSLVPDSNGNYAFIQTDFVRYDIQLNGNITVGTKTYTVANSYRVNCNGQNGFHLVVVDREDPATPYADNTYCTGTSDVEIQRLIGDLNTLTSAFTNEGRLVFLASNGKPIPANWDFGTNGDARFYPVAQQVARFGGYWETMVYLKPGDTYSLVGAVAPPAGTKNPYQRAREASSVYPEVRAGQRPSGELHGVLSRGRGNWYSPLNADPSGYANLGFYEVLATPYAPFPIPASGNSGQVAAFQYINGKLCASTGCNVREQYDDLNISFSTYQVVLQNMADANGRSCDVTGSGANADFCAVRSQLLTEFAYVTNIRAFYNNVQSLWLGSGTVSILELLSAVNTIKAQLPAPDAAPTPSLGEKIVNALLTAGSFLPEVGPVFGVADTAFNFGMDLTRNKNGIKTIDLTTTVGQLEQQASDQFTAQASTTGTLFDLIYQDWGKLSALGTALAGAQDSSSPWFWKSSATGTALTQMKPAIEQAAYQNIMAAAYAIGSFYPNSRTDNGWNWGFYPLAGQPYAYLVEVNRRSPSIPISHPFWVPAYIPHTFPGDPGNQWADDTRTASLLTDGQWLGISALNTPYNGTSDDFQYSPPSEAVRSLLFKPVWNGGLGVYRPAFFHSWPFPRVACDPSFGNRSGDHTWIGGCNWSAAAPAPEQVVGGRAITRVTLRASQSSLAAQPQPRPAQVSVMLTVHNNGTRTAQSVSIDSVTLRTLAGVGQAMLLGPALPIRVSNLLPGKSAHVPLTLNVPPGVVRLSLTQQGTITSGDARQPEVFRFSEAQALVLQ